MRQKTQRSEGRVCRTTFGPMKGQGRRHCCVTLQLHRSSRQTEKHNVRGPREITEVEYTIMRDHRNRDRVRLSEPSGDCDGLSVLLLNSSSTV